jgi:predicted AlkP superfamily pyrophosphatase or phosphodiesterase
MAEFSPNIASFLQSSELHVGVKTVFVSNTYPIHTSIATGVLPVKHGIKSNTEGDIWVTDSRKIKVNTLWDAARKAGLTTAAILWPVTGHGKIKYNLPEIHIRHKQNQVIENLRAGSPFFQLKEFLRHGKKLQGIAQPNLDDFVTAVSVDVLREKKPDLTMVHLTIYDDYFHRYGLDDYYLRKAASSLDRSLGQLVEAAGEDIKIILFSDHGQLPVFGMADPNLLLVKHRVPGHFILSGGCAFYCPQGRELDTLLRNSPLGIYLPEFQEDDDFVPGHREMREDLTKQRWFNRYLTDQEMEDSGFFPISSFGVAAKVGWCFSSGKTLYKGNHGYPVDYEDYQVFYGVSSQTPGRYEGGQITDITALVAETLQISL